MKIHPKKFAIKTHKLAGTSNVGVGVCARATVKIEKNVCITLVIIVLPRGDDITIELYLLVLTFLSVFLNLLLSCFVVCESVCVYAIKISFASFHIVTAF